MKCLVCAYHYASRGLYALCVAWLTWLSMASLYLVDYGLFIMCLIAQLSNSFEDMNISQLWTVHIPKQFITKRIYSICRPSLGVWGDLDEIRNIIWTLSTLSLICSEHSCHITEWAYSGSPSHCSHALYITVNLRSLRFYCTSLTNARGCLVQHKSVTV